MPKREVIEGKAAAMLANLPPVRPVWVSWRIAATVNMHRAAIARKAGHYKAARMYLGAAREQLQYARDTKCNAPLKFANDRLQTLPVAWLPAMSSPIK